MAEQRKESRSAASLKVKYKSATVDDFAQQFGTDVSRGGIFIKTKSPLEPGALLKLELQLSTAAAVISGIGRVAWRRVASTDPSRPAGMGIKFVKLEPASQVIVERIVIERGATPSRFDQNEGAELARASLEPPAPTSLAPERAPERVSSPGRVSSPDMGDAPATVRPPAPIAMPAAAVPNRLPMTAAASKPLTAATGALRAAHAQAQATSAASLAPSADSRARIGPTKAAIPSGLFAQSPLVQPTPSIAPAEEKRTSFFPPAPSTQPNARGGSNASGNLSAPRSSPGSVSSPLHRPAHSRAPSALQTSRAPAAGPKGVFGGPAPSSPLSGSTSGLMRPATEVSGLSSSSLLSDRSADEKPTAAVPRPPAARSMTRTQQVSAPASAPSVLESLVDDVFGEAAEADSGATSVDGMFATLEPLGGMKEAPPARGSRPSGSGPIADRVSPAPSANGRTSTHTGLGAAEAADVDNLFADLEGNDEVPTNEVVKPAPASAVFSPGSTRPSLPPGFDNLADDDAFGEADLLGDDRGVPPSEDEDEDEEQDDALASAVAMASEPPMLRLVEPAAQPKAEAKRSPAVTIGIAAVVLLVVAGGALALLKPQLLGFGTSPAPQAQPAQALPAAESPTAAAPAPTAAAPTAAAPTTAAPLPPAQLISVNVTSLPRGADVRVDGVAAGVTPTNIDLPLGRDANVTVAAQGHAAQTKIVSAVSGMEPLRFKLEPLPYLLVVTTTPAQAELSVGSVTSVSPAPLVLGHISNGVDVTVAKDGYRRMTRLVRLEEFVEKDGVLSAEIEITLSPMPGTSVAPTPNVAPPSAAPSSSRRSRRNGGSRSPEAPLAPPEPEAESAAPAAEAAPAEPAAAPEPAKAAEGPPPPPALPSLP